ncbi:MAG: DNA-deoxyinosine glycosylase, partial [Rhodocyclaceae bacterium]|nr:DNA-deoxyinosine glycosylase [Rhodocyclaceae bacterium]
RASLAAGRYYAHPHNQFWPILGELLGFDPGADYACRLACLCAAGIALWDVLESCARAGSLDADIIESSMVPNDFAGLFRRHPQLRVVLFNGAKAEQAFRRHVLGRVPAAVWFRDAANMAVAPVLIKLPSTSPAHASRTYAQKLAAWRAAFVAGGVAVTDGGAR